MSLTILLAFCNIFVFEFRDFAGLYFLLLGEGNKFCLIGFRTLLSLSSLDLRLINNHGSSDCGSWGLHWIWFLSWILTTCRDFIVFIGIRYKLLQESVLNSESNLLELLDLKAEFKLIDFTMPLDWRELNMEGWEFFWSEMAILYNIFWIWIIYTI